MVALISSIPGTHFYGQKLHPLSGADGPPMAVLAMADLTAPGQKPAFELSLIARGSEAVGGVARILPWTPPFRFVGLGTKGS